MRALILAAGKGTRMKSEKAKVLHEILGRPMLAHVLDTLESLGIRRIGIVGGAHAAQVQDFLKKHEPKAKARPQWILQNPQRGTGHAVMMSRTFIRSAKESVLIWPADMPLLKVETLRRLIQEHQASGAAVSVLSASVARPTGYGRILRRGESFYAIREELDAAEDERAVQEINTGIYIFESQPLQDALGKIQPNNAKKEYYLTDTIEILAQGGKGIAAFPLAGADEALGINSKQQLAEAIQMMNRREVEKHMANGVTIISPDQTYLESNLSIGPDTVIYPWTFIESGVKIGKRCQIGPFAKIRRGTEIQDDSTVGSFVEINRSKLGKKVLAKHLAYLGDAVLGDGTNVGAGTITANFDGKNKHVSRIGKGVKLGSNTVLIAPVTLEDGSTTGAGSVVTAGTCVVRGSTVAGVPAKPLQIKKKQKK